MEDYKDLIERLMPKQSEECHYAERCAMLITEVNRLTKVAQNYQEKWYDAVTLNTEMKGKIRELEQECNNPLTLAELREMDGEPVYIVAGEVRWWDIVSFSDSEYLYLRTEGTIPLSRYGEWLAYRHKPEEGTR